MLIVWPGLRSVSLSSVISSIPKSGVIADAAIFLGFLGDGIESPNSCNTSSTDFSETVDPCFSNLLD